MDFATISTIIKHQAFIDWARTLLTDGGTLATPSQGIACTAQFGYEVDLKTGGTRPTLFSLTDPKQGTFLVLFERFIAVSDTVTLYVIEAEVPHEGTFATIVAVDHATNRAIRADLLVSGLEFDTLVDVSTDTVAMFL